MIDRNKKRDQEIFTLYEKGQQGKASKVSMYDLALKYNLTPTGIFRIIHKMKKGKRVR